MSPTSLYPVSAKLYADATRVITGGVDSPSRSYEPVGLSHPVFAARAAGAYIWDEDGHQYIDYVAAFGPLILGHAHPAVAAAIHAQASRGTVYGVPTRWETELAATIREAIPSMEKMRFTGTGTEAVMSAIRLARAYTGRRYIVKFEGSYHGHYDGVLVEAGSGAATVGVSGASGVLPDLARFTLSVPYNDLGRLEAAVDKVRDDLAAILVEPIAGNMGIVPPAPGFLAGLVEIAHRAGALVIFDEVITGFRVTYGGAQNVLGITPDLTCLGKIVGGGLPIGVYGGPARIMEMVAPSGPVYQDGTFAGNPLAVRAGLATLNELRKPGVYERLDALTGRLSSGLQEIATRYGHAVTLNRWGSMFTLFFTPGPVRNYTEASSASRTQFAAMFRGFLQRGVLLAPSIYEAWMVSVAHSEDDIEKTLAAAEVVFRELPKSQT